jgi:hypothetical protein
MGQIAFNIAGAAQAASVTEDIIEAAIRNRRLIARHIEGKRIVILSTDLQAWLTNLPDYLAA